MNSDPPFQATSSYEELLEQNQSLLKAIAKLSSQETYNWKLFAETSRKLQVYSASIKVAVSSLLDYDIFWDSANQHEFLETINSSVNQVSELIVLLTLAFRAHANSMVINKDEQMLQEILSGAHAEALKKWPDIHLEVSFPAEGKPVQVDFEYLTKALLLFFDVFFTRCPSDQICVSAIETSSCWTLEFSGINAPILVVIEQMVHCKTQPMGIDFLPSENILKLHIACEILHLQDITVDVLERPEQSPILRLYIPVVKPA
jgi:hypothetical protein